MEAVEDTIGLAEHGERMDTVFAMIKPARMAEHHAFIQVQSCLADLVIFRPAIAGVCQG